MNTVVKGKCFNTNSACCQFILLSSSSTTCVVKLLNAAENILFEYQPTAMVSANAIQPHMMFSYCPCLRIFYNLH